MLHLGVDKREAARQVVDNSREVSLAAVSLVILSLRSYVALPLVDAARHGISPRYIRSLFALEQITFTDYLLRKRLMLVRRRLLDPRSDIRTMMVAEENGR
jgi:AraC-like DNA-binding protein